MVDCLVVACVARLCQREKSSGAWKMRRGKCRRVSSTKYQDRTVATVCSSSKRSPRLSNGSSILVLALHSASASSCTSLQKQSSWTVREKFFDGTNKQISQSVSQQNNSLACLITCRLRVLRRDEPAKFERVREEYQRARTHAHRSLRTSDRTRGVGSAAEK